MHGWRILNRLRYHLLPRHSHFFFNVSPHCVFLLSRERVYKYLKSPIQTARPRKTVCGAHNYLLSTGIEFAIRNAAANRSATAGTVP